MNKARASSQVSIYRNVLLALSIAAGISLSIVSLVLTINIPRHW